MSDNKTVKKILLLHVGGTCGMQRNEKGVYVTQPGMFLQKLKESNLHEKTLARKLNIKLKNNELLTGFLDKIIISELIEYKTLLDSSNMSTKDWIQIAKDIENYYESYDGFIILHGTDTLCYTSSALSFMFDGLSKPIILTGSQIPIFELRSDANDNILGSLILAGCYDIKEVCVYFSNKLLRGNRATKQKSVNLDAFISPNYHILAEIGIQINVYDYHIRKSPNAKFKLNSRLNPNVGALFFFPTITVSMVKSFLQPPIQGVVLLTYGAGNVPSLKKDIMETLKEAIDRDIIIVKVSHCLWGSVSSDYETGEALEQLGVLSGKDMTVETVLTKLCYVLGLPNLTCNERRKLMETNLKGECC